MEINIIWCPLSQRVGTIEVENQLIKILSEKKKNVYHLGVGNFFKNNNNKQNILLSQKFIKLSLRNSYLFYGRLSVLIQAIGGLVKIIKIVFAKKSTKIIVYTCLFPTPFLIAKAFLKIIKKDHYLKIINFIQGTPSFLRDENSKKRNFFFFIEDIIRKIIYSNIYNYSNYVVCSSKRLANQLGLLIKKDLIKIIPNGVIEEMPKKKNLLYLLDKNLDKEMLNLYFIGRLTFQKNIISLLHEFTKIYRNDSRINLKIIGDGDLYEEAYKKYSKYKNVSFEGFLAKPWDIIEENGIIIVPSLWEEPGHVPIEAFTNNRRFLISSGCSLSDFIKKGTKPNIVFEINQLGNFLKNLKSNINGENWYEYFDELNESLKNFTYKSFAEAVNEL